MLLVMTFAITSQFAMANAGYGFKQYLPVDDTYTLSSTGPIKHFIGYLVFNVFSNTSSSFHVSIKWTVGRTDTIDLIIHSIGCIDSTTGDTAQTVIDISGEKGGASEEAPPKQEK